MGNRPEPHGGKIHQVGLPRVRHDQGNALQDRPFDVIADHRRRLVRGGAQHENEIGPLQVAKGGGAEPPGQVSGQVPHAGMPGGSAAVVYIVRADQDPGDFLEKVIFLIGALGRAQKPNALGTVLVFDLH